MREPAGPGLDTVTAELLFNTAVLVDLMLLADSRGRPGDRRPAGGALEFDTQAARVCVYYCSTYYKAVRVGGG